MLKANADEHLNAKRKFGPTPECETHTQTNTKFKLAVLRSGKTEPEMEEILDFGALEEVD